jgi:hypothetical protein
MAQLTIGNLLGNPLSSVMMCEEIQPGDAPSYTACKIIMAYHPLGAKMTDSPVALAQSQERKITVPKGPESELVDAFLSEWKALGADGQIFNLCRLARGYGIASIGCLTEGTPPSSALDLNTVADQRIGFNVLDPLNTAGSLTLNQDPMSIDFQKVTGLAVGGVAFHRSRTVTLQNEHPLYIEWTSSAYGFTGRSVFQRALFPLKSFILSMIADDAVEQKIALLILKLVGPGSIIDQAMEAVGAVKRWLLKMAGTGNVLSIGRDEEVSSLDFTNMEGPHALARKNILDNIATACDMPAILLNQETFAEGFGEGTEDAKRVSQWIGRLRIWMNPAYDWMDVICRHRAWNPEFYKGIQERWPDEYGNKTYNQAFYEWSNSFTATWPNLIEEPDSEKIKVDDVKLKAVIAAVQVIMPDLDPENKVRALQWLTDCFNERKDLFPSPLELDFETLLQYSQEQAEQAKALAAAGQGGGESDDPAKPAPPFSGRDAQSALDVERSLAELTASVARLPELQRIAGTRRLAAVK